MQRNLICEKPKYIIIATQLSGRASTCKVNFSRNLTVGEQVMGIRGNISVMNNISGQERNSALSRMSSFVSNDMERSRESLP